MAFRHRSATQTQILSLTADAANNGIFDEARSHYESYLLAFSVQMGLTHSVWSYS